MSNRFVHVIMNQKKWWLPFLIIVCVSLTGLTIIGFQTYSDAPPLPNFTTESGETLLSKEDILRGQEVFHRYALMEYGTMFGDGGMRGPDFTAEALHVSTLAMREYYRQNTAQAGASAAELTDDAIAQRVRNEIKNNRYDAASNAVSLNAAQQFALKKTTAYYKQMFLASDHEASFKPANYITDEQELTDLAGFFFWGAWVCGVERPGENYSYTHNWPYDPDAGNTATSPVILWSVLGAFAFILVLGFVLYIYGQFDELTGNAYAEQSQPLFTQDRVSTFQPTASQRATYKFFAAAIVLFLIQVLAGVLTIHDFVGFVNFFGIDVSEILPLTLTRSWHLQIALYWISACWIGASIFVLPLIAKTEVPGQATFVNILFGLIVLLVGGSLVGIYLGPLGLLGAWSNFLGHQGWEFVEFGRLWQWLLFFIFIFWTYVVYRGLRPVLTFKQPWALPNWLVYTTFSISALFISGFIATPETNFVIADFWRWCVIHMWVEAFFEVFTTVIVGYFMVVMGLVNRSSVVKVTYIAMLLFLGSGLLGISHNFYWNAKPVITMALGSVFSTLQVIPLILLTLEAWRFRNMPRITALSQGLDDGSGRSFGLSEVFLFLIGVNFWNFLGAGVFGFIINLPIVNYFEHGSYLTVNHGHAALMGVYGNLSLAGMLFCTRLLVHSPRWNRQLVRRAFWSINVGLMLMVVLDLFPAGVHHFYEILDKGYWYARSQTFIQGDVFQTLTWLRIIGGALFVVGGIVPLLWLIITRFKSKKEPVIIASSAIEGEQLPSIA